MARQPSKRTYGSGSIVTLKGGLAIRWRELAIGADGQTIERRCYENLGAVSKKDAGSRLREKMQHADRVGPRQVEVIPTFQEHAARYERDILPVHKFSTRVVRKTILQHHLVPRFGPMLVSNITATTIQSLIGGLAEQGYTKAGRAEQYSAHALHDVAKLMRVLMRLSNKWYRQPLDPLSGLPFNPAEGLQLPPLEEKREQFALTSDEAGQLIGELQGKARVMAAVAITCGLRRGELLALRLKHLSVTEVDGRRLGRIDVKEASYLGHIDSPKTKKGKRGIDIPDRVLDLLEDLISRTRKRHPDDLVFGTRMNRMENSNNILRRRIYPVCERLGLPHVDWLTCRRTFQTLAHNDGVPARTIADIMGHVKVETQFKYYNQPVESMKRVAADRLNRVLSKIDQDSQNEPALVN